MMAATLPPSSAQAQASSKTVLDIRAQPGFQERTLACSADILINGGGAGPGKTFALLLEAMRHYRNRRFGATIFRRTSPEITKQGGLWDESWELYPHLKASPNQNELAWEFPSGARVQFAHMQHEKDKHNYAGSQIPLIGFDQLEQFTEGQFWFMWSRNRSVCGVRPYIRATCNPVPDDDPVGGWLHRLIQWWIDPNTGQIIHERDGVLRWFIREDEKIEWANSKDELLARFPGTNPAHILSFTFIEGKLAENTILKEKDPAYEAKLRALPRVERERLLHRNWNARPTAGQVFDRAWFEIVDAVPAQLVTCRYWDKAGTEGAGCYTAGVKMGKDTRTGLIYVLDVIRGQWSAGAREQLIRQMAELDGTDTKVYTEQEPGSGGKESAQNSVINLQGFSAFADPVRGNKLKRAYPMSAYAEAGNVKILRAEWNHDYLNELHGFDPDAGVFKDQVDASSGAFNKLSLHARAFVLSCAGAPLAQQVGAPSVVEQTIQRQGYYWPNGR